MKKIYNLQIDTSEMPAEATTRSFTISGERGGEFILYVLQNDTIKYYDFIDETFELGHNDKNNNLKILLSGNNYNGNIKFPSGGGTYTIKLVASLGTEIQGANKYVISRSIDKLASNATITFSPATTNTDNYATFPTTTSTGGPNESKSFSFDWDIVNASTDAGGFGLRLTDPLAEITEELWYFTTTDTVNGAVSSGTAVTLDDVTDIVEGMVITGVSGGSLSGEPYISSIDTSTKTLTISIAQTFADGITLTFKAIGSTVISNAIGLDVEFVPSNAVQGTVLTKTVRTDSDGDYTTSTTITLTDTQGVAGGNIITFTGVDVDNSDAPKVTSVTPDCPDPGDGTLDGDGSIVVQVTQLLRAGTVLTFNDIFKTINFRGTINITQYPSANRTIYLNMDKIITVGAAS